MPSYYDQLVRELRGAEQHQPPAPAFDAVDIAAGTRSFRKSMKDTARGLGKIKAPAAPKAPPVASPSEVMAKALSAFQSGKITGEQLAVLEARQHHLIDALAIRSRS